ncbi:amino acid ABC transporter substrate-binding protein [Pseudodesulfovibrio sp. S3]|nr:MULTISPECIES: ABC transporter substrate-binding protein [unclassified Pseudodesulfovibrio]MCJ2164879.1 transporter substrate-binding domain-containing protein [Pseudodesulfovibrio sp. S3-i]RWU03753.1 amino acid ABC transporter substrate-binding protein [Pseudodesulfovibrio sp. S3]
MRLNPICTILLILLLGFAAPGYCLDEIRIQPGSSEEDLRHTYPIALLMKALEATAESDGPFRITPGQVRMSRDRALEEIASGKHINLYIAATRNTWEERTIPIRIPIMKRLLSYRLLLINCRDMDRFAKIDSLQALKQLKGGTGLQWTITEVHRRHGFTLVTGNDYEGLFSMLDSGRFDYFSRGINEIFTEYETRKERFPDMCIEPTLALYSPSPSYFFVSPAYPKLADRIRRGMEIISANGELDALFQKHFGADIARAKLKERTVFRIDNPLLSKETPLDRPELWFTP